MFSSVMSSNLSHILVFAVASNFAGWFAVCDIHDTWTFNAILSLDHAFE